ncbi:MAG TPA: CHAT domain-containing protein [Thermoanaerobaculia bacterium]|nr:CHAT domain-containing protein [Thermoanaerobaculia bacterium]
MRHPGARSLCDAAVLMLFLDKHDRAVVLATAAAAKDPGDPMILADLGAVYLARAQRPVDPQPHDFVQALAAIEDARARGPRVAEILFNEALALERLFLRSQAREAWRGYLAIDPGSAWSREARAHLARLNDPTELEVWSARRGELERAALGGKRQAVARLVLRFPNQARLYAEEDLLGRWAEARSAGHESDSIRLLRIARGIGGALAACNGDHMLEASIAAIDQADRAGLRRATVIVAGHLAFQRALAAENRNDYTSALRGFSRAEAKLVAAGSPFSRWAILHEAICRNFLANYSTALALLGRARSGPAANRYPALEGRCLWILGLIRQETASLPQALQAHLAAARCFEILRETPYFGFLQAMVAVDLHFLGDRVPAWAYRYRALASVGQLEDPRRIYSVLWEAAQAALAEDKPRVALRFLDELSADPRLTTLPEVAAEVLLRRARIHNVIGAGKLARGDLQQASALLPRIADPVFRDRVTADLLISSGEVELRTNPRLAVDSLSAAARAYARLAYPLEAAAVYRLLAVGHRSLGDLDLAEQDLRLGIEDYERHRDAIVGEAAKVNYFEQARALSDEMISLQFMDRRDSLGAFAAAERAKARSLLAAIAAPGGSGELGSFAHPLDAPALRRLLPSDTALVEYAVLDDRLLIWVLSRRKFTVVAEPVSASVLAQAVDRYRGNLPVGEKTRDWQNAAANLYDRLIHPVMDDLRGVPNLVFIPDKALHEVSFAGLFNRRSQRFLVEDHACAVAPSGTHFIEALAISRRHPVGAGALVVVNPNFDRKAFPNLRPLPAAESEVQDVAAAFPGAVVLANSAATKRQVLSFLDRRRFELIHFSGHSVAYPHHPLSSALLLAREWQGDTGALAARELYQLHLRGTRLVVLASCSTAAGGPPTQEGVMNLARPFLFAGVPAVVASLWDVDDQSTARLLHGFYGYLRAGSVPAVALCNAQLDFLRAQVSTGPSAPTWAAFQLIGGWAAPRESDRPESR